MKKDIQIFLDKFNLKYKNHNKWKKVVGVLSLIIFIITTYLLIVPGFALNEVSPSYSLYLTDSYDYSWKENFVTEYSLDLYFMDTDGNYIEGRDLELNISATGFDDAVYGFGYVPVSDESTRGKDLISEWEIREYALVTGEKYVFDHAEVYVNDAWQIFLTDGNHFDIWCQNASSSDLKTEYGWRGTYGDNVSYMINDNTKYKFVYKLVRYGDEKTVSSLGADSGISFRIFNYSGDNTQTGINNNGLWDYFTFRDSSLEDAVTINLETDADGFTDKRAKVLPKLENGYPVFTCGDNCSNKSLGYLFGSSVNPLGTEPVGVVGYSPSNTLLQKETVDGVEYYYYDSNRNAVDYDTDNNQFLVRDYVERGYLLSTYEKESNRYEFLPFNYLNSDISLKNNVDTGLDYHYENEDIDHWFGMTMEFSFYMPKDGTINGKDMIFSFSGDDDVWVFVDDVLVLDLGGTHGAVDGTINFRTGEVSGYLNWNGVVGTPNKTTIYESFSNANEVGNVSWNEDMTTFDDYTLHTVKFFYLERGAAVSNCKIRFNIPVLPSGSLSVQKQYSGVSRYDEDYEFTLYDVTNDSEVVVANAKYVIGDNEFYTDKEGKFTLKNGEVATFKLTNYHKYYVAETNSGEHSVTDGCVLDGVNCDVIDKTKVFTLDPSSSHKAVFTNRIKTYNLKISKVVYGDDEGDLFKFKVSLRDKDGVVQVVADNIESENEYVIDNDDGSITYELGNNDYILINDIPIDTEVILKEVVHDGYTTVIKSRDVVLKNGDSYEFVMDENKDITVHNIASVVLPATGGAGIGSYILVGIIFMFMPLCFSFKYLFNMREGGYK